MSSPARDLLVAQAADLYLQKHAALTAAGTSPERPAAAKALADAWLHLTRSVAAWRKSREASRG